MKGPTHNLIFTPNSTTEITQVSATEENLDTGWLRDFAWYEEDPSPHTPQLRIKITITSEDPNQPHRVWYVESEIQARIVITTLWLSQLKS